MNKVPGLYGTVFSEADKQAAREQHRLLFISIMLNPVCNLACPDCYVGISGRNGDRGGVGRTHTYLGLQRRRTVLEEARALGARTLRIAGEGEPLLDRTFWPLVDHAKALGMDVFFFTNGTLIDSAMAERIASYGNLTPVVKFSGCPAFMEPFTGQKRMFGEDRFVAHDGMLIPMYVKNLIDVGVNSLDHRGQTKLGIEFLLRKANYGYAFDIFRWSRRNAIVPYFEQNLEAGSAMRWSSYRTERVSDVDAFRLSCRLQAIDNEEFGIDWIPSIPYLVGGICETEKSGCKKYTYNLVVSSNGACNPCYAAYYDLGNVRHQSLEEIMKHPIRIKLLQEPRYNCLCRVYSRSLRENEEVSALSDLDARFDYQSAY